MEEIIQAIRDSIASIVNPRFYETERGFQGELGAELRNRLNGLEIEGAIVEQEYQKRMKEHGFRIRPDIIIHIPFEGAGFSSRAEGNFVVIELKRQAIEGEALADYENLSAMCETLNYPLGVFINIGANETHIDKFQGQNKDRLRSFSVQLEDGMVAVREY